VEHSKVYESVVDITWVLNSVYKDSQPIKFNAQKLKFYANKSGTFETDKIVTPEKTASDGTTIPATTELETEDFTVTEDGEGKFTLTIKASSKSSSVVYAVDEPAQLLHLWFTDETGAETHYIYRDEKAKLKSQ
jgi:hypothetical protein